MAINSVNLAQGIQFKGDFMRLVILRLPAVLAATGYSRSTLYLRMTQGLWPKQVQLGAKSIGWPAHEVEAMNAIRIAGSSDEAIRVLVVNLEASRREIAEKAGVPNFASY
jgi:prophage regulatory protein